MDENSREEGFWRRALDEASHLPWPMPDVVWPSRTNFLVRLDELEAAALGMDFMGHSLCRLCGCQNGASEFMAGGWTWPEGLRHYIAVHRVRPSRDFELFVLG